SVGGDVEEPRAASGGSDVAGAAEDHVRVRLHVRRVDDGVGGGQLERLTQVDGERPAKRRRLAQLDRDHIMARLHGLTADLRAQVSGTAGDQEPHADVSPAGTTGARYLYVLRRKGITESAHPLGGDAETRAVRRQEGVTVRRRYLAPVVASRVEDDGDRSVVDKLELHLRAEDAAT